MQKLSTDHNGTWITVTPDPVTDCSYVINDLIPGSSNNQYRVLMSTSHDLGEKPIGQTEQFTACEVPGQPHAPVIKEVADVWVVISYQPPVDDGESPVTGYRVEMKKVDDTDWTKHCHHTATIPYVVNKLDLNCEYQFRIAAVNQAGCGVPSEPSRTVLITG